jgi:PmbA protein
VTEVLPTVSAPLVEKLLGMARVRKVEAEVYYLDRAETPIEFESNRLKSLTTKAIQGVALRVIHEGRVGFASSTDLSRMEELVDAAIATAAIGDPAEFEFAKSSTFDPEPSSYAPPSTDALVQRGEALIEKMHQFNPDILVSAGFTVNKAHSAIATTGGTFAQEASTVVSASLSGNLVRGQDFLEIYSYATERDGEPDYAALATELIEKYQRASSMASVQSGKLPVIFTPRAAAFVLGSLFRTAFNGQMIVQKASPLLGKEGLHLFDPRLNLYEDPTIGINHTPVDDEGTPTQAKHFIQDGVVQNFYWDRVWAARGGVQSTGNGFRSGLSRPSPGVVNLCMEGGQASFDELVSSIKEGLIVDQVLGAGQSNQLQGEFSVNLDLGYKIEQGKIVGRVKNTMVAGNLFEAFSNLEELSKETTWIFGSARLPAILFRNLGVVSRGS